MKRQIKYPVLTFFMLCVGVLGLYCIAAYNTLNGH